MFSATFTELRRRFRDFVSPDLTQDITSLEEDRSVGETVQGLLCM